MYISNDQLPKLKEYKYSSVDRSLLSKYVLKPFYTNVAIKCFPLWMAPNLITLSGFGFVILNFLTLLHYNPTLSENCPSWVYITWSVGLFLYQTFDAVDGTQARRTRQSGPLGELFDHGVDALNTATEVLLFAGAMNMGQGWKTLATLFACLFTFYIQTWDEYHTRTLYLGLVSGPVEGIMTLIIVFALTAILGGGSFWEQSLCATFGISKDMVGETLYGMAWNEWFMAYGGVVLVYNTVQSTLNVFAARRSRNEPPYPALYGLLPYFALWTLIPLYLALNPYILHNHLIPFTLYIGLLNAYSVGQIIVAHLTKADFPYNNILTLPLFFAFADSLGSYLQEHTGVGWPSVLGLGGHVALVYTSLGLSVGVYGSFVVDVIESICEYLDIWCLTIKHPWTEETEKKSKTKELKREREMMREESEGITESEMNGTSMRLRSAKKRTS